MSFKTELTRFKLKPNKESTVKEWMDLLRDNLPATLATLEDEKMYVESIFTDFEEGFMYWFSIQGEGGTSVHDSKHEIDKKHIEYMHECVDREHPLFKKDLQLELAMMQPKLAGLIKEN